MKTPWAFLILAAGPALSSDLRAAEIWNFTPADYAALRSSGRSLTFNPDSEWFPEELKRNLLATLNFVLDPRKNQRNTAGVNHQDFFHGHIGCRNSHGLSANLRNPYSDEMYAEREKLGREITVANFFAYSNLVRKAGTKFAEYFYDKTHSNQCAEWVVVYHTYEDKRPAGMDYGDPRRNLIMFWNDAGPQEWAPPARDDASTWMKVFTPLLHFSFVIAKNGQVRVANDFQGFEYFDRLTP